MHAGNDLGVGELPDVDMMAANNAGQPFDVLANFLYTDVLRGSL